MTLPGEWVICLVARWGASRIFANIWLVRKNAQFLKLLCSQRSFYLIIWVLQTSHNHCISTYPLHISPMTTSLIIPEKKGELRRGCVYNNGLPPKLTWGSASLNNRRKEQIDLAEWRTGMCTSLQQIRTRKLISSQELPIVKISSSGDHLLRDTIHISNYIT
jgi:hypothetical protein